MRGAVLGLALPPASGAYRAALPPFIRLMVGAGVKLVAIQRVLGAYRSTEATITQEQITAAWGEHDRARRLIEAQDRLIRLLDLGPSRDLAGQVDLARSDIAALREEQR